LWLGGAGVVGMVTCIDNIGGKVGWGGGGGGGGGN